MNTTQSITVINGYDVKLGDKVTHPRTGRTVEIMDELNLEGDGFRRFFVQGQRGGWDTLTIGEQTAIEALA